MDMEEGGGREETYCVDQDTEEEEWLRRVVHWLPEPEEEPQRLLYRVCTLGRVESHWPQKVVERGVRGRAVVRPARVARGRMAVVGFMVMRGDGDRASVDRGMDGGNRGKGIEQSGRRYIPSHFFVDATSQPTGES